NLLAKKVFPANRNREQTRCASATSQKEMQPCRKRHRRFFYVLLLKKTCLLWLVGTMIPKSSILWIVVYQRLWENAWLGLKSIPARGITVYMRWRMRKGALSARWNWIIFVGKEEKQSFGLGLVRNHTGTGVTEPLPSGRFWRKLFLISGWTPFIYGFTLLTGVRFIVMKRWAFAKRLF